MRKLYVLALTALLPGMAVRAEEPASAPAQKRSPAEVRSAGPGVGTAKRVQTVTVTVQAVDVAARILTVERVQGGGVQSIKVDPAVERLKDVAPGDTITAMYEQSLTLEYQPEGTASTMAAMKPIEKRGDARAPPSGTMGSELRIQVEVSATNSASRVVTLQDDRGEKFEVKAGPDIDFTRIKVGQRYLATYAETVAVKVEKAGASSR